MEFWDSKLSGKKKLTLDSRILVFNQFDDEDYYFTFTFCLGYNTFNVVQKGEDDYDVIIDGLRFKDLMKMEKEDKKNKQKKQEREKRILAEKKKKEQEYYNRALKYNGKDYYEGKEKHLINNNDINNKKPVKYDYNYYKEHKKDKRSS